MNTGPNIIRDGLILSLDVGNIKSFRGEATVNVLPSPINMSSGRVTSTGIIHTDFNSGGVNNSPFYRITRSIDTIPSPLWDFEFRDLNPGYPDGALHTFSFYARSIDGSTPTIKMSNPDIEHHFFSLTSEWVRYEATFTLGAQISGQIYLRINRSYQLLDIGSNYDLCMGQIEFKPYATPFVDGTRGVTPETGGGWLDKSGYGNDCSLFNNVIFNSDNIGSLSFNGTDNYIQTPLVGTFSQITFEFVGFFDDVTLNTTSRSESAFGDWYGNKIHFGTRWSVGMHWNVNNQWTSIPNTNLKYGWNHYILVYDVINNSKKVYINNVLSSTTGTNGDLTITDFKIGVATSLDKYYRGKIPIFKVYDKGLTQEEVTQNFNAIKSRYSL